MSTLIPGTEASTVEHKGDKTFLCQDVRNSHYESTLDISKYRLNPVVYKPQRDCGSASMLTHGSTALCSTNAYVRPEWAKPNNFENMQSETRCNHRTNGGDMM